VSATTYHQQNRDRPSFFSRLATKVDSELLPVYEAKTKSNLDKYHAEYKRSIQDPVGFWGEKGRHLLHWDRPFQSVVQGSLKNGDISWFQGGKLNVCYNAVDRHVQAGKGDKVAMIFEGDEPDDVKHVTYSQLMAKVCQIANALKAQGVKKGDVVTIYMPMSK
jgi:acetyl-CoA synthetase